MQEHGKLNDLLIRFVAVKVTNKWHGGWSSCFPPSPPSLLLRSFQFNSCSLLFPHFIPSFLVFHALRHPALLSLHLALLSPFCFPHIPLVLADCTTCYKVWRREPRAPCVTSKRCSPSLEHPAVLSNKEQRDPCLNSGKNKRHSVQPHYVNALCSYELWPQLKMTRANYGQ